jgi:hypothetical protein
MRWSVDRLIGTQDKEAAGPTMINGSTDQRIKPINGSTCSWRLA